MIEQNSSTNSPFSTLAAVFILIAGPASDIFCAS